MAEEVKVEVEVESDKESKEDQLKALLKDGKPFVRKYDGVAIKVDEDKEIKYLDYDKNENILKVPSGSYVVIGSDGWCDPKIISAEDFEKKNKFVEEPKEKPVESKPMGLDYLK